MNHGMGPRSGGWRFCALGFLLVFNAAGVAQTNLWISPNSGKWEETNSWSLGTLPGMSQSVFIQRTNPTTVLIDAITAQNYKSSFSVQSLTLGTSNTLAMNNTGEEALTASDGISLIGGKLILSNAVVSGHIYSSGGTVVQNGGLVYGGLLTTAGNYYLTNGMFWGEVYTLGGTFTQFGSNTLITNVRMDGGTYNLYSGTVNLTGLNMNARQAPITFNQQGGTNITTGTLNLDGLPWGGTVAVTYGLSGGLLNVSNVVVGPSSQLTQSGGTQVVGTMTIQGQDRYFPPQPSYPARVFVNGGQLRAGAILINGIYGYSSFTEYGGTTMADLVQLNAAQDGEICDFTIQSQFYCSNLQWLDGPVDITQSGDLVVSNLLSYGGYYAGAYNGYGARLAQYRFISGTLFASNIDLTADWVIYSSSAAGRITNPGYFQMGGILDVGDANEQLGRFVLTSNAVINFTGHNTVLAFAGSAAQTWSNGVLLVVSNWNGLVTGSGNHQLKFGTNASGLTSAQVNRIRFVNPGGFPAGTYAARILNTGEVVPYAPAVSAVKSGNGLVITWPDSSYFLQGATNVFGPWTNVVNASSPYTNNFAGGPQEFFRLIK